MRKRGINKSYIPSRGDISWVNLDPVRGHEQSGRRPVLVISDTVFNTATGLVLIVPITSKVKRYPVEVEISTAHIQGVALGSALRSIDWQGRPMEYIDSAPIDSLRAIQEMLVTFITRS